MKTKILIFLAVLGLNITARAQTPATPAPIVVAPPAILSVKQAKTFTLTPAQISNLEAALTAQGVSFAPGNDIAFIRVVFQYSTTAGALTLTGANVTVGFK